jgi:hypothetical protein
MEPRGRLWQSKSVRILLLLFVSAFISRAQSSHSGSTLVHGIGAPRGIHSVVLTWTASTSSGVAGYHIYRGAQSGGPYFKIDAIFIPPTIYLDLSVLPGQTYYYVATAVDSSGNESVYSNEAVTTIPAP